MRNTSILTLISSVLSFQTIFNNPQTCSTEQSCGAKNSDSCCAPRLGRYLFSLQWLDRAGPVDKFTIHGFWPDYCDGRPGPRSGCDSNRHYSDIGNKIKSLNSTLLEELDTFWPSMYGNNPSFWSHEWNKHGTCVSTLEPHCYESYVPYQDAHDYFVTVINLFKRYDYVKALAKSGIRPGRIYDREDIVKAFKTNLGLDATLKCRGKNLKEMHIHFLAAGRDILNPTESSERTSCPRKVNFFKKSPQILSRPALLRQSSDIHVIKLETTSSDVSI